jgi:cytochrome c biogenesis protein
MVVPGKTFGLQETASFKTNISAPLWLGQVPQWRIEVQDFRVEFYKHRPDVAQQYFSTLVLKSPTGQPLKQATISVNHPLVYDDVSIYQASFAPTGRFQMALDGHPLLLEVNTRFNNRPVSLQPIGLGETLIMFPFFANQDPGVTHNYAVFFIRKPGEPFVEGQMPANIRLKEGESGVLKGHRLTYQRPEMSTGLQIKRAPETTLMYLSYLIIALGASLCFFSQRQIWATIVEVMPGRTVVTLSPKTNKARLSFRRELQKIEAALLNTVELTQYRTNT